MQIVCNFAQVFIVIGFIGAGLFSGWLFFVHYARTTISLLRSQRVSKPYQNGFRGSYRFTISSFPCLSFGFLTFRDISRLQINS